MAILIHKIEKLQTRKRYSSFSFQMTPEKIPLVKSAPVTVKIGSIDTKQSGNILIAESDRGVQNDLERTLNLLAYSDFETVHTDNEFLTRVRQKVMRKIHPFFCICDYRMLFHPDFVRVEKLSFLNQVALPIVALVPNHCKSEDISIARVKNLEVLFKPIKFSLLRRMLFKYLGPPMKKLLH